MPNEYLKRHLNKSIMCPKCHRPFRARVVGVPMKIQAASFSWSSSQQQQGTNYPASIRFSVSGVKIPTASNSVQYNLVILALAQQLEQTFRRIKFLRRAMQIVCMPLQLGKLHTPASQLVET
uniref:Heat shock protein n=1 Tax=Solanum tuberosum TaxID=4113 RepID=M1B805_SOLTU